MSFRRILLLLPALFGLLNPIQTGAAEPAIRSCSALSHGIVGTGSPARGVKGIGGTGARPEGGDGIGGTGIQSNGGGGIGGTGIQAKGGDGIGGTGIQIAATLTESKGNIMAVDAAKQVFMLAKGSVVCPGDKIESGADASAQIAFRDGATIFLKSSTRIRIDGYIWAENAPEQSKMEIALMGGGLRSVSGKISKSHPDAYRLNSPDTQIRVLGTDYEVTHLNKSIKDTPAGTYASVSSGQIQMKNSRGAIVLSAGESGVSRLNVAPSQLPSRPSCISIQ